MESLDQAVCAQNDDIKLIHMFVVYGVSPSLLIRIYGLLMYGMSQLRPNMASQLSEALRVYMIDRLW